MNNIYEDTVSDEKKRLDGINIEFSSNHEGILFSNLTETKIWSWRNNKPQCAFYSRML